jgi:hypothetical protein
MIALAVIQVPMSQTDPLSNFGNCRTVKSHKGSTSGLKVVGGYVPMLAWLARRLPTTVNARMGEIM